MFLNYPQRSLTAPFVPYALFLQNFVSSDTKITRHGSVTFQTSPSSLPAAAVCNTNRLHQGRQVELSGGTILYGEINYQRW